MTVSWKPYQTAPSCLVSCCCILPACLDACLVVLLQHLHACSTVLWPRLPLTWLVPI
jgi:hypothetical protein